MDKNVKIRNNDFDLCKKIHKIWLSSYTPQANCLLLMEIN